MKIDTQKIVNLMLIRIHEQAIIFNKMGIKDILNMHPEKLERIRRKADKILDIETEYNIKITTAKIKEIWDRL